MQGFGVTATVYVGCVACLDWWGGTNATLKRPRLENEDGARAARAGSKTRKSEARGAARPEREKGGGPHGQCNSMEWLAGNTAKLFG
jgi:hypothetical protein